MPSLKTNKIKYLSCLDAPERAQYLRQTLDISRATAATLGQSALNAIRSGQYINAEGIAVDWHTQVQAMRLQKRSISPTDILPDDGGIKHQETRIQVSNETSLMAARRLTDAGLQPLTLNFANGIEPGGGFLRGARAQEESLCRCSALYEALRDDPMYAAHAKRPLPDSTDWAILTPNVPVFRNDEGAALAQPWLLNVLTCAAPYAPKVGREQSATLLRQRILRVLAIARAYRYSALVLGAWGCGAFGNDAYQTACDFHTAIASEGNGAFSDIVFAITDWSAERRFLAPFLKVFSTDFL